MAHKTQENKPEVSHPSQDQTSRFALDAMIREAGFKIHSRKKGKPVVWENNGVLIEQNDLVKQLNWHEVQDAVYEEKMYQRGGIEE